MVILMIDDDRDDYEFFEEALGRIDPSIVLWWEDQCRNALERLRQDFLKPDIIFLDINMPVMNGRDCLRELKNDARLKQIPVVMHSTTERRNEILEFENLGASFLIKQHTLDNSVSALSAILKAL